MGTKGPTVNFRSFLHGDLGELINGDLKSGRAYNRTKKTVSKQNSRPEEEKKTISIQNFGRQL